MNDNTLSQLRVFEVISGEGSFCLFAFFASLNADWSSKFSAAKSFRSINEKFSQKCHLYWNVSCKIASIMNHRRYSWILLFHCIAFIFLYVVCSRSFSFKEIACGDCRANRIPSMRFQSFISSIAIGIHLIGGWLTTVDLQKFLRVVQRIKYTCMASLLMRYQFAVMSISYFVIEMELIGLPFVHSHIRMNQLVCTMSVVRKTMKM